jgi:hypothetical protein
MEEEEKKQVAHCERCNQWKELEEIPFMGYSLWLCRACSVAAYRSGEAV